MERCPRRQPTLVVLRLSALIPVLAKNVLVVAAGPPLTVGGLADRFGRRRVMVAEPVAARALTGLDSAPVPRGGLGGLRHRSDRRADPGLRAGHAPPLRPGLPEQRVGRRHGDRRPPPMSESRVPARRFDPLGAALSLVGMVALVRAITELPQRGLGDPATLFELAVAMIATNGAGAALGRRTGDRLLIATGRVRHGDRHAGGARRRGRADAARRRRRAGVGGARAVRRGRVGAHDTVRQARVALGVAERAGGQVSAASAWQAFTDGSAVTCSVLAFVLIRGAGPTTSRPSKNSSP
ncbi:hypothetical protein ACSNOI_16730 [Actinomadura kijaniata]|uniref:hypothetical protein n=1 Tax=Actinomadura kijaniata TaxID=46161 RepID=UPI003F1DE40E